jgi:hypothetical protein
LGYALEWEKNWIFRFQVLGFFLYTLLFSHSVHRSLLPWIGLDNEFQEAYQEKQKCIVVLKQHHETVPEIQVSFTGLSVAEGAAAHMIDS